MSDHLVRLFADDAAVRHVGEGLLAHTLPRVEWTHEAHLAATAWLVFERRDILPESDLPAIIRRYNESVGGVNSDTQGYHETITQVFIVGVRCALARASGALVDRVNGLLAEPEGRRDWPLRYYSSARLFSVEARRVFIPPDLAPLPAVGRPTSAAGEPCGDASIPHPTRCTQAVSNEGASNG